MADYFIDAAAGGGGNGLSPGSAYTSLRSVVWSNGDIAWLRRTHVESFASTDVPVSQTNASGFAHFTAVVGWPDSLDPFFERRPASGISAGWDSDLPATAIYSVHGYKFPTLSSSNATAATAVPHGSTVCFANLALNQLSTGNQAIFRRLGTHPIVSNVFICQSFSVYGGRGSSAQFPIVADKLIWCYSVSNNNFLTNNDQVFIDHLVIPPASQGAFACPVNGGGAISYIGVLENQSNSISYFGNAFNATDGQNEQAVVRVRRAVGIMPFSGFSDNVAGSSFRYGSIVCDDYFGLGPNHARGGGNISYRLANSIEAMHNGARALFVRVGSATGLSIGFGALDHIVTVMRKLVTVTSGTPVTFAVPVYVDTTAVFSVNGFTAPVARLLAAGGKSVFPATVSPGSPGLWTGSLAAAGSAWILRYNFTPRETGQVPLDVEMPRMTNATSGASVPIGYMLMSEPHSV